MNHGVPAISAGSSLGRLRRPGVGGMITASLDGDRGKKSTGRRSGVREVHV